MATRRLPAAERKRQIAEAALDILAAKGARGLKAASLARAIGTTDATLFRHFGSMKEIVAAALERFEEELEATVPEALEGEPLEQLEHFVEARLERWQRRPELLRLITGDRLIDVAGPAGVRRIGALRQRSEAFVSDCLRRAQAAGQVGRDLRPDVLTWMVQGVIHGASRQGHAPPAGRKRPARPAADPAVVWSALETVLLRSARPSDRRKR